MNEPMRLAGDDEIIRLLEGIGTRPVPPVPMVSYAVTPATSGGIFDQTEAVRTALERIVSEQPDWALVRYGRVLQQLAVRDAELVRYRANVVSEIDRERADVQARMAVLDSIIAGEALRQREEGGPKSLTVPTIGTWSTRTVAGGWELPKDEEIIAALTEADRPLYVVTVTSEKVDRDAFRKGLDATIETLTGDEEGALTEEAARDEVAERYGITFRPARTSVKGPFA